MMEWKALPPSTDSARFIALSPSSPGEWRELSKVPAWVHHCCRVGPASRQSGRVISRERILFCLKVRKTCTLSTQEKVRKGLSGDEERAGCLQQIVPWVVTGYRLGIGNIVLRGKLANQLLL